MILIHCRYRIPPDVREAWIESSKRMAILSRAEEGCLGYAFSFDVIDPDIAYVYEKWADRKTFEAHRAVAHHAIRKAELHEMPGIEYQEIMRFEGWEEVNMLERYKPVVRD